MKNSPLMLPGIGSLWLALTLTLLSRASAQEPLEVLWSYDTGG